MISVIIGAGDNEENHFNNVWSELGKPYTISASDKDAFVSFCKQALQSTETLRVRIGMTDNYVDKIANDDMVVFFPKEYIQSLTIPLNYKLSTVIEVAMDLNLEVQVFSLRGDKDKEIDKLTWPRHWPPITYFN